MGIPVKHFSGALRKGRLLVLPANIRLGCKGLPRANALANYEKLKLTAVKSFITLATGINYIIILRPESSRSDQIHTNHCYGFSLTLFCYLSPTSMFNKLAWLVEWRVMLSSSFRCDQIHDNHCYEMATL